MVTRAATHTGADKKNTEKFGKLPSVKSIDYAKTTTMKKFFLALSLLATVYTVQAQEAVKTTAAQRSDKMVAQLEKKMQLTESQKKYMDEVFTNYYRSNDAYVNSGETARIGDVIKERDARVKLLLNDDAKYQTYLGIIHAKPAGNTRAVK